MAEAPLFIVSNFETWYYISIIETMKHSRNSKAYQTLAAWLKKERLDQGLSIRDLACMLDVHPSIVGKIETCMRKIDAIELIEYCNALGVDPNDCTAEVQAVMRGERLL